MTTTREMTRETVRAARTKSELLTARPPSWAAAVAVSDTAPKYGLQHARFDLRLRFRRDQQQHVAVVQGGVMLAQVGDRVRQLRVGDVVTAPPRDPRIVQPDARRVVADDRHEVRHRPPGLLVVAVIARVMTVPKPVRPHLGEQRPAG